MWGIRPKGAVRCLLNSDRQELLNWKDPAIVIISAMSHPSIPSHPQKQNWSTIHTFHTNRRNYFPIKLFLTAFRERHCTTCIDSRNSLLWPNLPTSDVSCQRKWFVFSLSITSTGTCRLTFCVQYVYLFLFLFFKRWLYLFGIMLSFIVKDPSHLDDSTNLMLVL